MSLTSKAASALVRATARQQVAVAPACAALQQTRSQASLTDASTSHAEWKSPFSRGSSGQQDTTKIPSFKNYKAGSETSNKVFQYFMVGAFGGLSAMGAKDTVQSELSPEAPENAKGNERRSSYPQCGRYTEMRGNMS